MQVSYGILLVTLFLSNTNGQPINVQYLCNYDYSPFWSGNHILLGDIFGRFKSKRCSYFMTSDASTSATTESPIDSTPTTISMTSFGATNSEVKLKSPKLAQRKKKVCQTTISIIPILSLSNMMRFKQFYQPKTKCHWIESESEESTISTTATPSSSTTLTSQPPTTRSRPILFKL